MKKKINVVDVLLVVAIFSLCLANSIPFGGTANFYPINGDFQNFNPIRRLFDGQIPYRDFSLYLGSGHLFFGSLFTFLIGGASPDFMASKIAFCFCAAFAFSWIVYALFRGVLCDYKRTVSLIATNIVLLFVLVNPEVFKNALAISGEISDALQSAFTKSNAASNSARFIREVAPAVYVSLFFAVKKLLSKVKIIQNKFESWIPAMTTGIVSGIIFYYSNDYGFSCVICAFLLFIIFDFASKKKTREKIISILILLAVFLISLLITGEIITMGHIQDYMRYTFGTGGFQTWYYLGEKSFYLYEIDLNFWVCLQAYISVVYLVLLFKNREDDRAFIRYGTPLFFNMVAYAAVNEYALLSGEHTLHEVAFTILYATIVAEVVGFVLKICKIETDNLIKASKAVGLFVGVFAFVWCVQKVFPYATTIGAGREETTYIENLGYVSDLDESIVKANQILGDDKRVFATYASAVETSREQFQPSGFDYLIHVLGDKSREKYIKSFDEGNFEYAATINDAYVGWEYWVRNVNWFFYRELYAEYEPAFTTEYEVFWKKSDNSNPVSEGELSGVECISPGEYKVIVSAPGVKYGIADVVMSYDIVKNPSPRSLLTLNTMLRVSNNSGASVSGERLDELYNLPASAKEMNVGVTIIDGVGEIVITSLPERNTAINNLVVEVKSVFSQGALDYSKVNGIRIEEDGTLTIGITNSGRNHLLCQNASAVNIGGEWVDATFEEQDSVIYVNVIRDSIVDEWCSQWESNDIIHIK